MLSILLLLAAAPTCDVVGTDVSLRAVDVSVPRLKTARLGLSHVDLTARFGPRGQERLTVTSPVSLVGKAPRLWFSVQRVFSTADGLVTLKRGAQVIPRKTKGVDARGVAWVEVDVVLYADDVLAEENDKAPDETLSPVLVPCDALGFGATREDEPESFDGGVEGEDLKGVSVRRSSIALRSAPRQGAATRTLRSANCTESCLFLYVLRTLPGGWLEVATQETIGDDLEARGFVRSSEVAALPEGLGFGRSVMCTGDHHDSDEGFGFGGVARPMRQGPVTARVNVPVEVDGQVVLRTTRELELTVVGEADAKAFTIMGMTGVDLPPEWSASIDAASLLALPPLMPMKK